MIKMRDKWAVGINITNECQHGCINCIKFVRHSLDKHKGRMTLEQIENAIISVIEFPNKIGLTGGDPLNHPEFEEICSLIKKYIPKSKVMIFTSHKKKLNKYKKLIDETFGEVYLNFHTKTQQLICSHQPIMLAVGDVVKDELLRNILIENCWCNKMWSPIVGSNGAFFCDCALGIDNILELGGGWKVTKNWWDRDSYKDQMDKYCKYCGMPVPFKPQKQIEKKEIISRNLYELLTSLNLRNLDRMEIFDGVLTEQDIIRNMKNWTPWRNRPDKVAEGPAYTNK